MNKIIKLGTAVLFALFIAACNKADPAADYQKLVEWSLANQQSQVAFQQEYMEKLSSGDEKQIAEAMNALSARNAEVQKSLNTLDIKSAEIEQLKDKMQSVLTLTSELAKDGLALMNNASEEATKAIQAKTEKTTAATEELKKLQDEMAAKYGKKADQPK
ncbi:hypothetical protein L5B97_10420 [Avibacterium sp. 20-15]|uniref:hypothetical protein n=1 Tax=unclassified Avibacterium TaxID=2685287 RepID=UPI0020275070|nr:MULTISPECIES: hypothetical protein [unclassified Avibacterium]MCW9733866.1 hypothetical protein [Avibacterium sp. 20-15]URL03975.1 hypothetical protein L4F93_10515 [Avibacterium sp. 20-132]